MSQLQYIGARYVPVWYVNSVDGTSDWEVNVEYEPLTFVTSQNNHLYISKKEVPDNIGTPAQNTEYWLDMGVFSGSYQDLEPRVENLEDAVSDINDDITDINSDLAKKELNQANRKYILIFDSYGGLGSPTTVAGYAESACPGGYHTLQIGGAGFVGAGGGQTWNQAFETYMQSLTQDERDAFTDIMIFGGINDYSFTQNDIIAAISDFNDLKDTYCPQCNITLAPCSWATRLDGTISAYVNTALTAYAYASSVHGWGYYNGLNAHIHCDIYMSSDGIHPTNSGAKYLGQAIATFIKNGAISSFSTKSLVATFTPESPFTNTALTKFVTSLNDGISHIAGGLVLNASVPATCQSGMNNALRLGTLTNTYFHGTAAEDYPSNTVTVPAYIHNTGVNPSVWELKPITIQIYYGLVYMSVEGGNITFDAIQTPWFEMNAPLDRG